MFREEKSKRILCGLELRETRTQFFLKCLQLLLALANQLCLHLAIESFAKSLIISLAIYDAESTR